jgi:hypothetical protein
MSISPGTRFFKRIAASFSLVFLILISLILTGSMQPTPVKAQGEGGGLEGTWLNDVKIVACAPGPPVVFETFQSMITYMRGGVLIEDGSPPAPGAVSRSTGHGIWKPASEHSFHVFFRFHTFDERGRLNSIVEVTTDPTLKNRELSGNGTNTITVINPDDGTVVNVTRGCNEATSRRFTFQD